MQGYFDLSDEELSKIYFDLKEEYERFKSK